VGAAHPYRDLWTESLELNLEIAIPARVAAVLGWNQLPAESQQISAPDPVIRETILSR